MISHQAFLTWKVIHPFPVDLAFQMSEDQFQHFGNEMPELPARGKKLNQCHQPESPGFLLESPHPFMTLTISPLHEYSLYQKQEWCMWLKTYTWGQLGHRLGQKLCLRGHVRCRRISVLAFCKQLRHKANLLSAWKLWWRETWSWEELPRKYLSQSPTRILNA
jgi:hypothetical protein